MALIQQAARFIRNGQLVAFPTETVYGLGADATNDMAVASIYTVKGRPQFNPLIAHVSSIAMAEKYVQVSEKAKLLMQTFWPGPLTLVLKRVPNCPISLLVSAGLDTLAVRMPNHQMALRLIEQAGFPIAAPSANTSGQISPTTAQHVQADLGSKVDLILDGGACSVGVESTVLLLTDDKAVLLRPGGITPQELETVLKMPVTSHLTDDTAPRSPGQLSSHYAPHKRVRINVDSPDSDETLLGFGAVKSKYNLSSQGNLTEAAANLFSYLHLMDADDSVVNIAVSPVPNTGIGLAINDRLSRAAKKEKENAK